MSQGLASTYTYVASSLDGRASFLDLKVMADSHEMTRHAQRLLADHRSCDKVEVWADSVCVAVVERQPDDATAPSGWRSQPRAFFERSGSGSREEKCVKTED